MREYCLAALSKASWGSTAHRRGARVCEQMSGPNLIDPLRRTLPPHTCSFTLTPLAYSIPSARGEPLRADAAASRRYPPRRSSAHASPSQGLKGRHNTAPGEARGLPKEKGRSEPVLSERKTVGRSSLQAGSNLSPSPPTPRATLRSALGCLVPGFQPSIRPVLLPNRNIARLDAVNLGATDVRPSTRDVRPRSRGTLGPGLALWQGKTVAGETRRGRYPFPGDSLESERPPFQHRKKTETLCCKVLCHALH